MFLSPSFVSFLHFTYISRHLPPSLSLSLCFICLFAIPSAHSNVFLPPSTRPQTAELPPIVTIILSGLKELAISKLTDFVQEGQRLSVPRVEDAWLNLCFVKNLIIVSNDCQDWLYKLPLTKVSHY